MIRCGHEICNACNTEAYEWDERIFLYRFLATHGDSVFVDVGAHVGLYGRTISELLDKNATYDKTCRIMSIEPDLGTIGILMHNVPDGMVFAMAAWNRAMKLYLHKNVTGGKENAHGLVSATQISSDDVFTIGIPIDFLFYSEFPKTLAIKVDVEGAEYETLNGMEESITVADHVAIVVELSNRHMSIYGRSPEDVVKLLANRDVHPVDGKQLLDVAQGKKRNVYFVKDVK